MLKFTILSEHRAEVFMHQHPVMSLGEGLNSTTAWFMVNIFFKRLLMYRTCFYILDHLLIDLPGGFLAPVFLEHGVL